MSKKVGVLVAALALSSLSVIPASASGVVAAASGAGHVTSGDANRTFSFAAQKLSDGQARGEAQLKVRAINATVHLEIDCLRVVAGRAFMSGTVTRSTDPNVPAGQTFVFTVEDNGEGAEATDRMTPTRFGDPITCDTASPPEVAFRVVERGNVQVR